MNAKRFYLDGSYDVPVVSSGAALPSGFLVQPGTYAVAGVAYDMTDPGVYFFAGLSPANAGRRAVTDSDPLEMASVFSIASKHGARDNGLSIAQLNYEARSRFVGISCGVVSPWLLSWLTAAGFTARIVRFLTMETPNGYDDGHVAVEIFRNGAWMLVDADLGRFYRSLSGAALSARDFVAAAPGWSLSVSPLTPDPAKIDTVGPLANPGGMDYASYSWNVLGNDARKQDWTQRICQAVGIDAADGNTYWLLPEGAEGRKTWVEAQSLRWKVDVDPGVWNDRFYLPA